jgi:hypothetical protein
MQVALTNKQKGVTIQTWMIMTEDERRLGTNASSAMRKPIPFTPLAVTEEPLLGGVKRMKYPDELYPAPDKFTGAVSGMPDTSFHRQAHPILVNSTPDGCTQ